MIPPTHSKNLRTQMYTDKVGMHFGERSHKWWECLPEKPVPPSSLHNSPTKHQQDDSLTVKELSVQQAVSSATRMTNLLGSRIVLSDNWNPEINVIPNKETIDFYIYDKIVNKRVYTCLSSILLL